MTLKQPRPAEIKHIRDLAGLDRRQAAELVHALDQEGKGSYRTWQNYELETDSTEARPIPMATWELFLRKLEERGPRDPAAIAAGNLLRGRRAS